MDLDAIERRVRRVNADVLLAPSRLVRRVIKRHRALSGFGLQVPHARGYALPRAALLALVDASDLGDAAASLPEQVILLQRPTPSEIAGLTTDDVLVDLWRAIVHARIHLAIEALALDDAAVRERVDRLGQTEFAEIRLVLRHDEHLFPAHDDRDAYVEFAALYLELTRFAPATVGHLFPSLLDRARVDEALARDVDVDALLDRSRPDGLAPATARTPDDRGPRAAFRSAPSDPIGPSHVLAAGALALAPGADAPADRDLPITLAPRAPSPAAYGARITAADAARASGNVVRSALLRLGAIPVASLDGANTAASEARADLHVLATRLGHALAEEPRASAAPILLALAERAALGRTLHFTAEARLLYDLQRAAVAHERPASAVDAVEWALSLGRRPLVRPLPKTREVRIARELRHAAEKVAHVHLGLADRARLLDLIHHLRARAEANVRAALRPPLIAVLRDVGLHPASIPEHVAFEKLTDELLDQVVARGYVNLGHLRDAISRNQLKLASLSGPRELIAGDALLAADRRLAVAIDGVYRRGEIYLRFLQKLSSLAFGTAPGRLLVLYLVLPLGAAFVILEGVSHLVAPIAKRLGAGHVHLVTTPSFAVTSALLFGLIHSARVRAAALAIVRAVGRAIRAVVIDLPRWIASRPLVRAIVDSALVRGVARYALKPLAVAAVLYAVTPLHRLRPQVSAAPTIAAFLAANVILNSKLAAAAREIAIDWLAHQWRFLHRRVLPGLLRLIADAFRGLLERVDRVIYDVDERLRFRQGEHPLALAAKVVLGVVWFVIAYLVRLYTNLLIEPQVNPIKHFPVVTVSHKIILPFSPTLLSAFKKPLSPLGPVVANTVAGTTVVLLPGVFGFLVWEFKENWRLYRASRPSELRPVIIGHHGESMGALLKPGFHSGTLPKLYAKLRRAARREDAGRSLARCEEALHEVEGAVRRFFERELASLLARSPRWKNGPLQVDEIVTASNRVRVALRCPASPDPCWITFEEQSGWLLASVPRAGFLDALDDEARMLFEDALAGLYRLAGVDLAREPIEAWIVEAFGEPRAWDIAEEGLVVWPERDYRVEIVYDLHGGPELRPHVRGGPAPAPPPSLEARRVLLRRRPILWADWVASWDAERPATRLAEGASLLPNRRVAS